MTSYDMGFVLGWLLTRVGLLSLIFISFKQLGGWWAAVAALSTLLFLWFVVEDRK